MDDNDKKIINEAHKIAIGVLKNAKPKKEMCLEQCPQATNGDSFCHKKKGHKGLHSAVLKWGFCEDGEYCES